MSASGNKPSDRFPPPCPPRPSDIDPVTGGSHKNPSSPGRGATTFPSPTGVSTVFEIAVMRHRKVFRSMVPKPCFLLDLFGPPWFIGGIERDRSMV